MDNGLKGINRISFKELWRPFLVRVPVRFKSVIVQKEINWSITVLKGMITLWSTWYVGLILFSDTQKEPEHRYPYMGIRLFVVGLSILFQFFLSKPNIKRNVVGAITIFLAGLYLSSYLAFSFMSLPIRTTWVTILPAAFLLSTPRSGRLAVLTYLLLIGLGLIVFQQPISTIYVVSDILFGLVLIGGGLIVKDLWIKSIVLMLEQEESQRLALQNEIKILEAVEGFIPKGIRYKIRCGLASGETISEVISEMSIPTEQHIAVLYSDYRNYSVRSSSIDFVKNELISSSYPIIEFSEEVFAIVQNRGDSIMATFMGGSKNYNVARALLAGVKSANQEYIRVKAAGKNVVDRYMIVTSGNAVFCSLGNESRQEITIAGKPANLAARLDEITKTKIVNEKIIEKPYVLFDFATKNTLLEISKNLPYEEIDLKQENIEVRSYLEERRVFLLPYSAVGVALLEEYLRTFNKPNSEVA
jgi:class 3 adenylate cyclase